MRLRLGKDDRETYALVLGVDAVQTAADERLLPALVDPVNDGLRAAASSGAIVRARQHERNESLLCHSLPFPTPSPLHVLFLPFSSLGPFSFLISLFLVRVSVGPFLLPDRFRDHALLLRLLVHLPFSFVSLDRVRTGLLLPPHLQESRTRARAPWAPVPWRAASRGSPPARPRPRSLRGSMSVDASRWSAFDSPAHGGSSGANGPARRAAQRRRRSAQRPQLRASGSASSGASSRGGGKKWGWK